MSVSLREKLHKSMDEQWAMRFKTRHPDKDDYDGVIVHIGATFVVLREVRDLMVDGLILLPKRAIRGIRDNELEACENEVLRQSGGLKKVKAPAWLRDCVRLADVFTCIRRKSVWPGIETVCTNGSSAFYLGPLQDVTKQSVSIMCYNAAGQWEKVYTLPLDDVFRVEFDSQYCNVFNRYMRSKTPRLFVGRVRKPRQAKWFQR